MDGSRAGKCDGGCCDGISGVSGVSGERLLTTWYMTSLGYSIG